MSSRGITSTLPELVIRQPNPTIPSTDGTLTHPDTLL
jgi:hypothetical protein